MSTRLTDLLIIEIKDTIVYTFSKEDLRLYRLKKPNNFELEIGIFINCNIDNIANEIHECSQLSRRNAVEDDFVRIELSETGPMLVMKSYMVFSKNASLLSNKMNNGFSDWYGYIRTPFPSLRKFRDCVYVMDIIIDDLDYEKTSGACLFRQYTARVGNKKKSFDYLKQAELREIDLKNRNSTKRNQNVGSNSQKSESPTSERSMSKKAVEYKVLVLRYDLETKMLYGFNKDERCLMTVQLEYEDKIRVGSSVTFIVCGRTNDVYTPEIGSVRIDNSEEIDIINYLEDNVEIRTKISFSTVPSHFTHGKKIAFSDSFGFVDVGHFDVNFQPNYIYDTVVRIKQYRDKDLPCFEAIKSPKIVHEFVHEREFLQNMNEFETKRVESRRENFGANGFASEPREHRRPKHNPYYTRDNYGHSWIKSEIRNEYQQMIVIALYDKPINRSYGLVSTVYGDADLFVTCDDAGEHHLKTGDWFKGVLDKKKNSSRLVVEKVERIIEPQADFYVFENRFFITIDLDLLNEKPKNESSTLIEHCILRSCVIGNEFYDLLGKRVVVELVFVPDSRESSWKVHKFIAELPDRMSFPRWKALQNQGQEKKQDENENPNSPEPRYGVPNLDDLEDDIDGLLLDSDDNEPAPPSKPKKNSSNKYPTSNEPRGYKQNYPPPQAAGTDECDSRSNASYHRSEPPPNRNHSTSRTESQYSQSNRHVYQNERSDSRSNNSSEKTLCNENKSGNFKKYEKEYGIVTQKLNDERNEYIVYSNTTKAPVLYRLIHGSTNARLGEFFWFKTQRVSDPTAHYQYEITEVIKIDGGQLPNPVKVVGNYAQMGVIVIPRDFKAEFAPYGMFVVFTSDVGDVVYGENIEAPGHRHLSSGQFHEMYRDCDTKLLCYCQYEYGKSHRDGSYQYGWILYSCEGTVAAHLNREHLMESRNLRNHEQYREEDDIAQAKRINAENARNMHSNYTSRAPTSMSEQHFRERQYDQDFRSTNESSSYQNYREPQRNWQQSRSSPEDSKQRNGYSSQDQSRRYEEDSRSTNGSSSYQNFRETPVNNSQQTRSSPDNFSQRNVHSPRQDDRMYEKDYKSAQGSSSCQNGKETQNAASSSGSAGGGEVDYEVGFHILYAQLKEIYKLNNTMHEEATIRQNIKQVDRQFFEDWEKSVKKTRDVLISTKKK